MYLLLFKQCCNSSLKGVLATLLCVYLVTQYIELKHVIERDIDRDKRPLSERTSQVVTPQILLNTPVNKLLQLEYQQGLLSTEELHLAIRIMAHAETALSSQFYRQNIASRAQAVDFLAAMGRYIDTHYIYQTRLPLGRGFLFGALDCDMRVFLYLSVAMSLGFNDFYFVSAPGHALVGWQGEGEEILLWETTSRLGHEADLSQQKLYQPVASKQYGDYQLASYESTLLQSHITASTAWVQSRDKGPDSLSRALDLFDRSLEQFPTANIAAAKVLIGSDNLLLDMPLSPAYAEYARVYPYAQGAQLYRLSLFLQTPSADHKASMLARADVLLKQGVVSPIVEAMLSRYGNYWQKFDGVYVQKAAQNLGQALYPSQPFLTQKDSVAEGRVIIYIAVCLSLLVGFTAFALTFFHGYRARSQY